MVKLLDFWAEWCVDPQTPVLTEKGYQFASDIKADQKLVSVDPHTYEQSFKSVRKIRIFKNRPSQQITLETGRILIGDINHLVLTPTGFRPFNDLRVGD